METSLVTKNVRIGERRTSVRLEPQLWAALEEIAEREQKSLSEICTLIAAVRRVRGGFTSALRVYIIEYFRRRLAQLERDEPANSNAPRRRRPPSKPPTRRQWAFSV